VDVRLRNVSAVFLTNSPDGNNVYGAIITAIGGEFRGVRVGVGIESCKIMLLAALHIH